jgi:hypothetical protein
VFVAKSRLREKELRRRRHRYLKRKKQRIKQAILEARLRKLEQQRQAAETAVTAVPAAERIAETIPVAMESTPEVGTSSAEPPASNEASTQDAQTVPSEF